jgi:hypothetical protein
MTSAPPFVVLPSLMGCLAGAPYEWARMQFQQLALIKRRLDQSTGGPEAQRADSAWHALGDLLQGLCALPFDALRLQHAAAVRAGAWPSSLLESQRFEGQIGRAERLLLGPLARRV